MAFVNNPYLNPYIYGSQPVQPQATTQQSSSIVPIASEQEARSYPVGLGNSVMFQNESEPFRFYAKTMGKSVLDTPIFEKFHLVKDDGNVTDAAETNSNKEEIDLSVYALKDDFKPILAQLNNIKNDISYLKDRIKKKTYREVVEDDE